MTTKIQVKTVANGKERHVELDRAQLNFQHLKSELSRKTQQRGQWYIRAGSRAINNDSDLKDAVVEAEKKGESFLTVELTGGSAPPPQRAQSTTAARPAAAAPPPQTYNPPPAQTYNPPPAYNVQPTYNAQPTYSSPPPVVQTAGVITSVYLPGDPSGADRPRVNTQQEPSAYVFTPTPTQVGTRIEVSLKTRENFNLR